MSARQLGLAARVAFATLVGVLALAGDSLASAKCNTSQTTKTYRVETRQLVRFADGDSTRLLVQASRAARAAAAAADKGCDRTGHGIAANNLDGLSPGGAASVRVTSPAAATFTGEKVFRAAYRISFDDDHPHKPGDAPS